MLSRALTYQPQQQTHFLTITLTKPSYFADEYIQGNVELNITNSVILNDIYLTFNVVENWLTKGEDNADIGDTYNECLMSMYLDIKKKLNINTNLVSLNPGKFTFPFYFKIQKLIPPSFEYPTQEASAYIRYTLNAQIVSPYIKGTATNYVLINSRPVIQKKELLFSSSSNIHKWGLFNKGFTTLNVSITNGTDSFKVGEIIVLNIEVDNTKGKLVSEECKLTLNRIINLKSKYGKNIKEIKKECLSEKIKAVTKVNEKKTFPATLSLKEMNNNIFNYMGGVKIPYTNISDMTYFLPSLKSFILECKYEFKATLYFSGFVKHDERPRIIIPIHICHQSIGEYNTEVQKYYGNQNQTNNSQINNNQINNSQIINNQYNNNTQYNNQYNINNQQLHDNINRSKSLMTNSSQPPLPSEINGGDNENDDLDLPTQEEIEKPSHISNENVKSETGEPDAPAPAFPSNMNYNNSNF